MERLLRRILVMGFGFVLAASCGALFLPIAALADRTVREAGFEAAIGGLFAMLDETARSRAARPSSTSLIATNDAAAAQGTAARTT